MNETEGDDQSILRTLRLIMLLQKELRSTETHGSQSQRIWYRLVDTTGRAFRDTSVDAISLDEVEGSNLLTLRSEILTRNTSIMHGHVSSHLTVYMSPHDFETGRFLPLTTTLDEIIHDTSEKDPLIIVVMCQMRLAALSLMTRSSDILLHEAHPQFRQHVPFQSTLSECAHAPPFLPRENSIEPSDQCVDTQPLAVSTRLHAKDALNNIVPELKYLTPPFLADMDSHFGMGNVSYGVNRKGGVLVAFREECYTNGIKFAHKDVKSVCEKHGVRFANIRRFDEALNACKPNQQGFLYPQTKTNKGSANSGSKYVVKWEPSKYSSSELTGPKGFENATDSERFQPMIFAMTLAGGIPTLKSELELAIDPKKLQKMGYHSFDAYLDAAERSGIVELAVIVEENVEDILVSLKSEKVRSMHQHDNPLKTKTIRKKKKTPLAQQTKLASQNQGEPAATATLSQRSNENEVWTRNPYLNQAGGNGYVASQHQNDDEDEWGPPPDNIPSPLQYGVDPGVTATLSQSSDENDAWTTNAELNHIGGSGHMASHCQNEDEYERGRPLAENFDFEHASSQSTLSEFVHAPPLLPCENFTEASDQCVDTQPPLASSELSLNPEMATVSTRLRAKDVLNNLVPELKYLTPPFLADMESHFGTGNVFYGVNRKGGVLVTFRKECNANGIKFTYKDVQIVCEKHGVRFANIQGFDEAISRRSKIVLNCGASKASS